MLQLPRAGIRDLIENLSDEVMVIWGGESEHFMGPTDGHPGVRMVLNIGAYQGKGTDDYALTSSGNIMGSVINGYRLFTLSIRCESYDFNYPAYDYLETVRRRLRSRTTRDFVPTLGLALVRIEPIRNLDVNADNRPIYVSTMDIRMAFAVSETSTDEDGGTIETVNGNNIVPAVPPLAP